MKIDPDDILARFHPYRPDGYTSARAIENLRAKVANPVFRSDLTLMVTAWPADYDVGSAAALIIESLLRRV